MAAMWGLRIIRSVLIIESEDIRIYIASSRRRGVNDHTSGSRRSILQ